MRDLTPEEQREADADWVVYVESDRKERRKVEEGMGGDFHWLSPEPTWGDLMFLDNLKYDLADRADKRRRGPPSPVATQLVLRFDLPHGKLTLLTHEWGTRAFMDCKELERRIEQGLSIDEPWHVYIDGRLTAEMEDGVRHTGLLIETPVELGSHAIRYARGTPKALLDATLQLFRTFDESQEAVLAALDVRPYCHFCGRGLHDVVSRDSGVGPTCAKKRGVERAEIIKLRTARRQALLAGNGGPA